DQLELSAEVETKRSQHARHHRRLVGGEQDRRDGLGAEGVELLVREELRDRRADLSLLVENEIREALRPPLLRDSVEPFEVGPRELLRDAQEAYGRRVREDAELGGARHLG